MTPLAALALAGCLAVPSGADHITTADLAAAIPAWAAIPLMPVAPAPAPGVERVFRASELERLAARYGVTAGAPSDVCFARPVAPLDPARITAAMRRQMPKAKIEILEYSRVPVPAGEIEFPRQGLRAAPWGGLWMGAVSYGGGRHMAVWARVKVLVPAPRVVATQDLKAGRVVEPSQLGIETREEFPGAGSFVTSVEEAAGRILRRAVPSGSALCTSWLEPPREVTRGETVKVEVWNGAAHLEFEAEAQASGSAGQTIPVLNPLSKKRFPARVSAKGRVVVGKEGL